jgi:DNA-binding GntR family transcriptional regulator
MKPLAASLNLVDQVREAILGAIASGVLAPGERVVQERLAETLGVSRQPVQQALALLYSQGVLRDAPGRRLIVAPLDADYLRQMYDMRAVIEGLAFREAALRNAAKAAKLGPALIEAGRKAVASGVVSKMIAADMKFHAFIHDLSGNPLVESTLAPHLNYLQRVMGQVLQREPTQRDVWLEHEKMLALVARGDGAGAEKMARQHIVDSATFMIANLTAQAQESTAEAGA